MKEEKVLENLLLLLDMSSWILIVLIMGSWLERFRGVSRVQCWSISPISSVAVAAKISMNDSDIPL